MPSNLPLFLKSLTSGRVIQIRRKRPLETGTSASHPSPLTTAGSPENVSCANKSRLAEAGDVAELVLRGFGIGGGAIPVAGPIVKAVADFLLYASEIIDTKNRNKADLDKLVSRLQQLFDILSQQPEPLDEKEARRREALTKHLNDTSAKLMAMRGRRGHKFTYNSVTKDIAGYIADVDHFVLDYQLYIQGQILLRLDLLASPRGCVILIDAMGHEHELPLKFSTSLQQLEKMLDVVLTSPRRGASVQRRYFESGKFDLCIDDGKRVVQLSSGSNEWPNIEAAIYTCHLCGARNTFSQPIGFNEWVTDGSVDWFVLGIH